MSEPVHQVAGGYERDFGEGCDRVHLNCQNPRMIPTTVCADASGGCVTEQCLDFLKAFRDKENNLKYKDMMVC